MNCRDRPIDQMGRLSDPVVMSIRDASFVAAFVAIMLIGAASQAEAMDNNPERATPVTVCEIKREEASGRGQARLVSITTHAYHEYHGGFFLSEPGCVDPSDGTGLLEIHLPAGQGLSDFPELLKLVSDEWLHDAIGRRVYCICVGEVSFDRGYAVFTIRQAEKVWASRH